MTLIRHIDAAGETVGRDLAGTLAALARDDVVSFPALRPHQRQPWHAFAVQVAALALHRAGTDASPLAAEAWPLAAEDWRALLTGLTPDWPDGEPWALVVDDWSRPALLQPPVAKPADVAAYKGEARTPDALDMLVTSKNHDLKARRMTQASDDDWLFALISLQTQEGFMGAGNFGISRMNGGFGSRLALSVRPGGRPGAAFARDVGALLGARGEMLRTHPALAEDGLGLVWLEPWDGAASRPFRGLDPFYVEICRRVRIVGERGERRARVANSKAARIEAKALTGRTGDPWAPIAADATKSITPTGAGFGYRQMARLLDPGSTRLPPLAEIRQGDGAAGAEDGLEIVASALVRGQGKTEGYHERRIKVSDKARGLFNRQGQRALDHAGGLAQIRAKAAGEMGGVLRRALFVLLMGGEARTRLDDAATDAKARPWLRLYDLDVDADFFDTSFWDAVAESDGLGDPGAEAWVRRLREMADASLTRAFAQAPRSDTRRVPVQAEARDRFEREAAKLVRNAREGAPPPASASTGKAREHA